MSRPPRFDEAARKLIAEVGLNREIGMSAAEFAQTIDVPTSAVSRVLGVMQRVGTARKRDEYTGKGGRKIFYTLTGDYAETTRRMRLRRIPWSGYIEANGPLKPPPTEPQNGGTVKDLAELAPLRKSEPRAEIEVARKYRDQQSFITQQRKMFEEMGLQLPQIPESLTADRKTELDALVRVLPYIESLEKTNERLEEQNRTIRQPATELAEARTQLARQSDQIERMVREKNEVKDDVQRVMDEHKRVVQDYKNTVGALEAEIRRLKGDKAINGAVTRHEEALSKVR